MKKIVLALTIVAFSVAVQAGDGKTCSKDKAACGGKDQTACAGKAGSSCCSKSGSMAKTTCPKKQAAKQWLMSPKAAGELASTK